MQLGGGAWTTCPGAWGDGDARAPAARMLGGYLTGVFLLQSSDCKGSEQLRATQTSPSGCYGAMGLWGLIGGRRQMEISILDSGGRSSCLATRRAFCS